MEELHGIGRHHWRGGGGGDPDSSEAGAGDSIDFKDGFRLDLLVEKCVILEVKSLERGLAPVHTKQLLTYLRLTNLQVGLLLNFGGGTMKEGIKRIVKDLPPSASPRLRINQ